MQSASDFILLKFGDIKFMLIAVGSLSNLTIESYVRLSNLWFSIHTVISLIVFVRLDIIE